MALANLNDGRQHKKRESLSKLPLRTLASLCVLYFKIISTSLSLCGSSAHLHIPLEKSLAATDSSSNSVVKHHCLNQVCVCVFSALSPGTTQKQVGDSLLYHQITLLLTHMQNYQKQRSVLKM